MLKNYVIAIIAISWLAACAPSTPKQSVSELIKISGQTMGSGYNISYIDSAKRDFKPQIDSIFEDFNRQLSTYDSTSVISKFNYGTSLAIAPKQDKELVMVMEISQRIYKETNGYFNPAVKPLVNYWGFGYKKKKPREEADPRVVDSLLKLANFDKVHLLHHEDFSVDITKDDPRIQIEFNAIAPGFAADLIARMLERNGITNYLVEVGGEIRANGVPNLANPQGWKVGINTPDPNAAYNDFAAVVELRNLSLATSGNYRNFYEANGKKYVHTINPKTGYTEQNSLLSVSVFAPTCAEADAYATSFMAMGVEQAYAFADTMPHLHAYFIYADSATNEVKERFTNRARQFFIE